LFAAGMLHIWNDGMRTPRSVSLEGTIRFRQQIQDSPAGRRTNSGQELDNTKPRHSITHVLRHTQEREDIFDMRRFEELQTAVLYERNITLG